MKKILIISIVSLMICLTGCSNRSFNYILDDKEIVEFHNLLSAKTISNDSNTVIIVDEINNEYFVKSYNIIDRYSISLTKYVTTFSYDKIEKEIKKVGKDSMGNDIVEGYIEAEFDNLYNFTSYVLDLYSDEFKYYSVSDFISLALELFDSPGIKVTYNQDKFNRYRYVIESTLPNVNLPDKLHEALLLSSDNYKEYLESHNYSFSIKLAISTDEEQSYLLPNFEFFINNKLITEIV